MGKVDYPVAGAMVSWNLQDTDLYAARVAFERAGLGHLAPGPKTEYEALKAAVGEAAKSKDQLIQRHKKHEKHRCELVDVNRGEEVNDYSHCLSFKVVDGQVKRKTAGGYSWDSDYSGKIQAEFDKQIQLVAPAKLTAALVAVIQDLQGVRLRERGGLYWLPEEAVEKWSTLADALEVAGNDMLVLRTELNPRTAHHLTKALQEQVMQEAQAIIDDLGKRLDYDGLVKRRDAASDLVALVEAYSRILGDGLENLKNVAGLAQSAAVQAAMQGMAKSGNGSLVGAA